MRYAPQHKAQTHQRIVKNAARRFRVLGVNGAGVAQVMQASRLTVGGFYKHFRSKDDLLVEAIGESLCEIRERILSCARQAPPGEAWKEMVSSYLSVEHCEHPEAGCPIAALAPDISRAKPSVRKRIAGVMKEHQDQILAFVPGRNAAEKERNFILAITAMAGAVSFARTMTDPVAKQRVLDTVRDHLLESF